MSGARNERILEALGRARREDHLHHAYLLTGPEPLAKIDCVERFAAAVFAEGGGDLGGLFGVDSADGPTVGKPTDLLGRIQRRAHPDFLRLEPAEGGVLGVDEVRELPKALSYPPLEAPLRIVLVTDAAAMNSQAANAVLKILEEPPAHTVFFLLARGKEELLPTVVSRCQALRFGPLTEAALRALVEGDAGQGETLLGFSEGSRERLEALRAREGGVDLSQRACLELLGLWEAAPRVTSSLLNFLEQLEGEEPCEIVLDSFELLLRDLAFAAAGAPAGELRFPAFHARLAGLASRPGREVLGMLPRLAAAINRFRVYQRQNGNLRLDLATLGAELQAFR